MYARSLSFDASFDGKYVVYYFDDRALMARKGMGQVWYKRFREEIIDAELVPGGVYFFFKDKILKTNFFGEVIRELETPAEIFRGKVNPATEEIIVQGEGKTYVYFEGSWKEYPFPNGYSHCGKFLGISGEEDLEGSEEIAFNEDLFVSLKRDGKIHARRTDGTGECVIKDLPPKIKMKLLGPTLQVITDDGAYSLPIGAMNLGEELFLNSFTEVFKLRAPVLSSEGPYYISSNVLYEVKGNSAFSISGAMTFIRGGETIAILMDGYRLLLPFLGRIYELSDSFDKLGKTKGGKITLSRGMLLAVLDYSTGNQVARYTSLDEILDHMANNKGDVVLVFQDHVEVYRKEETIELQIVPKDFCIENEALFLATSDGLYEINLSKGGEKEIEEGIFELVDSYDRFLVAKDSEDIIHFWEREGEEYVKKWAFRTDTVIMDVKVGRDGVYCVSPVEYLLISYSGKLLERELI